MFFIFGTRTARIKKYTDNQKRCENCKTFGFEVKIYKDYFHLFYIPVFPVGSKSAKVNCNSCGRSIHTETIQRHYESINRTPFYLYAFPVIFLVLLLILVIGNINNQEQKKYFVDNPQVGDVYLIRKEENNAPIYYFLKLASMKEDTIIAYHNTFIYYNFTTKLGDEDYFVKNDKLIFTKKELKQMLNKMEINSV